MRFLAVLVLAAAPAYADEPPRQTPFDQGRISLSAGGGTTSTLGHQYVVMGGGVGYYVLDGVELSLHGLYEFGDGPSISLLSPQLGVVYEQIVSSCTMDCSSVYPDITIGFSF